MRKHNWKNIWHRNTHYSQWGRHVVIVGIGVQELCRFPWVAWKPMSHHNPLSQWDDPTVTCHTHCSQHVVTYRHTQAQRYSQQGKKTWQKVIEPNLTTQLHSYKHAKMSDNSHETATKADWRSLNQTSPLNFSQTLQYFSVSSGKCFILKPTQWIPNHCGSL